MYPRLMLASLVMIHRPLVNHLSALIINQRNAGVDDVATVYVCFGIVTDDVRDVLRAGGSRHVPNGSNGSFVCHASQNRC